MPRRALVVTSERSKGAHAMRDALARAGMDAEFTTLGGAAGLAAGAELRVDRSLPPYDLPVLRWHGHWWNRPDHVHAAWSKQHTAMVVRGVAAHPPTVLVEHLDPAVVDSAYVPPLERAREILDLLGSPVVVKPDRGMQGDGVQLARTPSELVAALELVRVGVAQTYLPKAATTLRLVCTTRRCVAAFARVAKDGDWRGNVGAGASVERVSVSSIPDEVTLALQALRALKLDMAGIDIVEGPSGPVFLEANPSFGVAALLDLFPNAMDDVVSDLLTGRGCGCGQSTPHDCMDGM